MAKPAIITVDDDPAVLRAIQRDLNRQYGEEYQIVAAPSGSAAVDILRSLAEQDREVALIVSDQRMPAMTGVELLAQSKDHAPEAKLVLLTAYADTDVAIKAINDIDLDYYLMKPWDPPEDKLYPVLDDLLAEWRRAHPVDVGVRVVGHRWSARSHEIKTFLGRNYIPYRWLDLERDAEARKIHERAQAAVTDLPLVQIPDRALLRAPSTLDLARALDLRTNPEKPLYDLCIVGGGPAGLAAAVYGASEGLSTVVVEAHAPGGQAGQSARIENYLGFPQGLRGVELAQRAVDQARRLRAEMVLPREVVGLDTRGPVRVVRFADGGEIEAWTVLIATGVSYRLLEAPGLAEFSGNGVFYGASASDARGCQGEDVIVVGAANSAGQAVLNLAKFARQVHLVVRGASLEEKMSSYLVERIVEAPNVEVRLQSEISAGRGGDHLEEVTLLDRASGVKQEISTNWVFAFIGAVPRTDWLGEEIARDPHGFVLTGTDIVFGKGAWSWPLEQRQPMALETSVPGVFAAGDVRRDSMKRVASAVGEGAMAVHLVHRYLATV